MISPGDFGDKILQEKPTFFKTQYKMILKNGTAVTKGRDTALFVEKGQDPVDVVGGGHVPVRIDFRFDQGFVF